MAIELNENNRTEKAEKEEKATKKVFLVARFQLILHTKVAQVLFDGEWKSGRMGLLQFAKLMTTLWKSSKHDDPYAEWYLLKTYESLQNARDKLKHYEITLQQQLNNLRGFEVELMTNPTPLKHPLRFVTPFAFMAAMLIEQLDYVNRQLFTLHRMGLLADENLMPAHLMREVQAVFRLPKEWKYTGITRKDILEGNQKAEQAKKLLGDVPLAILNKEIQFAFLPKSKMY
jgi:integrating conjugative element protein (TIGR03761 family)